MKPPSLTRLLLAASACMTASISAQNFADGAPTVEARPQAEHAASSARLPEVKAEGIIPEARPEYVLQNALTLDVQESQPRSVESVVDLDVLKQASVYREISTGSAPDKTAPEDASIKNELALISASYREPAKATAARDSREIVLAVRQRILMDHSETLKTVEEEVTANPAFACEIVKAAIQASFADTELATAIVRTAIQASPENMRLISQCAIASSPESLAAIQALMAELDPNAGEGASAKGGSKSAKAEVMAQVSRGPTSGNPLDLPPVYSNGPPPIMPPAITQVNP